METKTESGTATAKSPAPTLDCSNHFAVGANGDSIAFARTVPRNITASEALILAAWLVVIAEPLANGLRFSEVREKIVMRHIVGRRLTYKELTGKEGETSEPF
jgi:hypothetical protein